MNEVTGHGDYVTHTPVLGSRLRHSLMRSLRPVSSQAPVPHRGMSDVQNHAGPANAQIRKVMIDGSWGRLYSGHCGHCRITVNAAETITTTAMTPRAERLGAGILRTTSRCLDLAAGATTNQIGSDFLILDSGGCHCKPCRDECSPITWTIAVTARVGALELTITPWSMPAEAVSRLQRDLGDTSSVCLQTFLTNAGDITTFEF